HDARVHADGGVVEEQAIVDAAHVHARDPSTGDGGHRALEVERDPEVLGEVVEGTDRQHAQDTGCPGENPGHAAQGPVSTGGDDDLGAIEDDASGLRGVLAG